MNPPHHLATSVTANSGSATGGVPLGSAAAAAGGEPVGAVPAVAAAAQHHQGLAGVAAVGEGMRVLGGEVPRRVRRAAIAGAHITMGGAPGGNSLAPGLPAAGLVAFGGHGSALVPLAVLGVIAAPAPVNSGFRTSGFTADTSCARHDHHLRTLKRLKVYIGAVSAAMGLVSGSEEKGKEAPDRPRKAKPRPQYQNGTSPHSGELLRIRRNPLSLGPRGYER